MKRIINISILSVSLFLSSCGFLDVDPQVICEDNFYKTEKDMLNGLAGVYGVMSNYGFYGNYYTFDCSGVDDLCYVNRPASSVAEVTNLYKHSAGTQQIFEVWTEIYEGIKNANAFMNASESVRSDSLDPEGKLYNEARFLRAYYHFILAQAWGNIPVRTEEVTSLDAVSCPAMPQYEALSWSAEEMEACLQLADRTLDNAPSRVTANTIHGILSRVYLFMAGESVEGGDKKALYGKAMEHADSVITSGLHRLNDDYSAVFKNMISDRYDTEFRESMWEVDFYGSRESADRWTNGRIGELNGLQNTSTTGFDQFMCNFSTARYNASLKLWNLYWYLDREEQDKGVSNEASKKFDARQEWNMPPYNYQATAGKSKSGYVYLGKNSLNDPLTARAMRNTGKWRREVEYEGLIRKRELHTGINFPILRYSDVLLMYAEASLEYNEAVNQKAYDCVKAVRDRAGVLTNDISTYDVASFREFVRNERGRELCFEATRKYDLIRWGIFVEEMNRYVDWTSDPEWMGQSGLAGYAAELGNAVEAKHILLPIPLKELGTNKELKQNPMW